MKIRSQISARELSEKADFLNSNNQILSKNSSQSLTSLTNKQFNALNPKFNLSEIDGQKLSVEYLKNVLLKYIESIAIGNEFQTKILENVIFTMLNINDIEKVKLEEKRQRSSFYYNLWYNAKAFLSANFYKANNIDNNTSINNINDNHNLNNINNLNNEMALNKSLDDMSINLEIEGKKEKEKLKFNEI